MSDEVKSFRISLEQNEGRKLQAILHIETRIGSSTYNISNLLSVDKYGERAVFLVHKLREALIESVDIPDDPVPGPTIVPDQKCDSCGQFALYRRADGRNQCSRHYDGLQ